MDLTPGPGGEFEAMLRDPNEQFDRRSELLKSIVEYAQAEPASASGNGTPKDGLVAVVLSAADVEQIRAEAYRVGREDGLRQANNAITWNTTCLNCSALLDIGIREHEAGHRAGREDAARDIAQAIEFAAAADRSPRLVGHDAVLGWDGRQFAYDHAAALARDLRVPDCGGEYHGADGGPCSRCGFDVADQGNQPRTPLAAETMDTESSPEVDR